ncbi:zinc-binding dehydrogenase [Pseudonocardia sp. GCM10023141]|uniref:zinc-binding dehydrogenase n=1 Tax=Pseudonocardia sp. GCM10023141 TaxID=3252653 RepID=UPI0036068EB1
MWAQQLVAPSTLAEVDVAAPTKDDLRGGEVLLEVLAGGVCGSDLPAFKGTAAAQGAAAGPDGPRPGAPLHEVVARVLASTDPAHEVGGRVVGWATGFDGLAERVISRGDDLAPVTTALAPARAVLLQPLACVLYAVEQLPRVRGANAAVVGLGPIGLLFAHVLRAAGATRVTGVDLVDRSAVASDFGLDETVRASSDRWSAGIAAADRPDVIVEAIGHSAAPLNHAIRACAPQGCVFAFGVPDDPIYPIDVEAMLRRNLTLMSGITLERPRMLLAAADYLTAHPDLVDTYVTDVRPADQAQQAFAAAVRPAPDQVKITLDYA